MMREYDIKNVWLQVETFLQELLTPIVEALIAVGRLFRVGVYGILEPLFEELGIFFEDKILAENCVCL